MPVLSLKCRRCAKNGIFLEDEDKLVAAVSKSFILFTLSVGTSQILHSGYFLAHFIKKIKNRQKFW